MIRRLFVAVVLVAFAASASAKELWERPWIEVRSPHFVIVSALSEKETVDLAGDLERFRVAVQIVTSIGRFEERVPTKVYVLPYPEKKLGFRRETKGYLIPAMRANYAAVTPGPGLALDDALKHEYVHFLIRNRDELRYPHWFDEGFAEVLSTLTARGDRIDYGQPMRMRMVWLANESWMPFDRLLDTRDVLELSDPRLAKFYSQSWLLMHYLIFGRPDRNLATDVNEFLRRVESGAVPSEAFGPAFGIPTSQLHDTLLNYVKNDIKATRLSNQNLPDAPVEVGPVLADSIAAQLAMLALLWNEPDEAKRYWDAALALNPNNTLALVGVGDSLKHEGHFDEAQAFYEKALALEPQNATVELDYAEYFLDRAIATKDQQEAATYLTEARRHFSRSYKLDAQNPETLAMNGASYLRPGESTAKALESLTAAHAMLPSQPQIKYLLAQAYVMNGEPKKAEPMLRSVIAWSETGTPEEASKLLQQLSSAAAQGGESAPTEPAPSQ